MIEKEVWGDWVEHDQSHVPAEVLGQMVHYFCEKRNGDLLESKAQMPTSFCDIGALCWLGGGPLIGGFYALPVLRYRIRKNGGYGDQVLQEIVRNPARPISGPEGSIRQLSDVAP